MPTRKKDVVHSDEWQLQEAKNRLSRVVEEARAIQKSEGTFAARMKRNL